MAKSHFGCGESYKQPLCRKQTIFLSLFNDVNSFSSKPVSELMVGLVFMLLFTKTEHYRCLKPKHFTGRKATTNLYEKTFAMKLKSPSPSTSSNRDLLRIPGLQTSTTTWKFCKFHSIYINFPLKLFSCQEKY